MPPVPVPRRTVVAALGLAAPTAPRAQMAGAAWPTQPVRYINGYPAGGPTDTLSRLYCARIEITGQQFMVENRSGSGGIVGTDAIAKSPDGTTVGLGGIATHAIAPTLYASLPFDHRRDFTLVFSRSAKLAGVVR
jgi:tripartite-type tricarboxylate transporter receptor subunit TctC